MPKFSTVQKYYHTIKYLKIKQLVNRVFRKYKRIKVPSDFNFSINNKGDAFASFITGEKKIFSENECVFLGIKGDFSNWNDPSKSKLWLYNLHYFDDLLANENPQLHIELIDKWIDENPPLFGNGWEPYPLSLRIVNWIKFFSLKSINNKNHSESLFQQVEVLYQTLEYHLLGNHLFANAKALIFAGCYFNGKYAEKWLHKGLSILKEELSEQVLSDGGNFELSPMYHNIILIDVLDLINLSMSHKKTPLNLYEDRLISCAEEMLHWMDVMTHSDGEVSFFNDSSIGIVPAALNIKEYAGRLGISTSKQIGRLVTLDASGYSRITEKKHTLIFDHASVGPNYLPGHAHADSLSFEWSVGEQRVFVNSGTSVYGNSSERLRQRKTSAHNTLVVNGEDSSEVWGGFRVARRAFCKLHTADISSDEVKLFASHNGYKRLKPEVTHFRQVKTMSDTLYIEDHVEGSFHSAVAFLHCHPNIKVDNQSDMIILTLPNEDVIKVESSAVMTVENSTWHPRFGQSIACKQIVMQLNEPHLFVKCTILLKENS